MRPRAAWLVIVNWRRTKRTPSCRIIRWQSAIQRRRIPPGNAGRGAFVDGGSCRRVIIINPSKFALTLRKPDYFKRSLCRLNVREDLRVVEPRRIEVGPEGNPIVFTQEGSAASAVYDITHLALRRDCEESLFGGQTRSFHDRFCLELRID